MVQDAQSAGKSKAGSRHAEMRLPEPQDHISCQKQFRPRHFSGAVRTLYGLDFAPRTAHLQFRPDLKDCTALFVSQTDIETRIAIHPGTWALVDPISAFRFSTKRNV